MIYFSWKNLIKRGEVFMVRKVLSFLGLFLLFFGAFASSSYAKVIHPVSEAYGEDWVWRVNDNAWLLTEMMKDKSGNLVYCLTPSYPSPNGHDLDEIGPVSELSANVLRVGYPHNNWGLSKTKAHYATQVALYIANGAYSLSDLRFDDKTIKKSVQNLLQAAEGLDYSESPVLDVSTDQVEANISGDNYMTPVINVGGDQGTYTVSLQGSPKGAAVVDENGNTKETFNIGEGFKIRFNSEESGNFSIVIDGSFEKTTTMAYEGNSKGVQNVVQLLPITNNNLAEVAVSWTAEGGLVVNKTDQQGNPLAGASFEVTNDQGEIISKGKADENGVVIFNNLRTGQYQLYETEAPEGYVLDKNKYDVEIRNGKTTELAIQNKLIQGVLKIYKYDAETNEVLKGAEFTIYNEDGKEVAKILTDQDGVAEAKLPYGNYSFKETKSPKGYSLNENVFHFEIKTDGQMIEKRIGNQADTETPALNYDQGQSNKNNDQQLGGRLPNTADDSLKNATIGIGIAILGFFLLFIRRKLPN